MSSPADIRRIFEDLLERPVSEREQALSALDPATRARVADLLARHDEDSDFLDVADVPPTDALPFDRLGGVKLQAEIGVGGTGTVYRGIDEATGATVAVKLLFFGLASRGAARERFEREAIVAGRLEHPAIVPVLRAGSERGSHYLVMPFVDGSTLARELDPARRLGLGPDPDDPRAVARFGAEIAGALAFAHTHGVIHRDVKPSNILIGRDRHPRVSDFGLAHDDEASRNLTRTGDIAGTIPYMSPEQIRGERDRIDEQTDVYSLGVVLYEMLSGHRPFAADTTVELARAIESSDPRPLARLAPDVPSDLRTIVSKAVEVDVTERYATMEAFATDLRAFAAGEPVAARPPSRVSRVRRSARRRRRSLSLTLITVALTALGVAAGLALRSPSGTPVDLIADPPEASVWYRAWDPGTREFGPAEPLGSAGRRVRVASGLARFVFVDDDGRMAELSRDIPRPEDLDGDAAFEVRATLVDSTAVLDGMLRIPGGDFSMAEIVPSPWVGRVDRWEGPAFAIDPHEVTIGAFRRFVRATARDSTRFPLLVLPDSLDDRPMANVPFRDARAYAEWAGKRLPTAAEFQRAAAGRAADAPDWTLEFEEYENPREDLAYDRALDPEDASTLTDVEHFARAVPPVGSHPLDRSTFGVDDIIASVSELLDAPWVSYSENDSTRSVDLATRVAAGVSWKAWTSDPHWLAQRPIGANARAGLDVGFRCARSLDPFGTFRRTEVGIGQSF